MNLLPETPYKPENAITVSPSQLSLWYSCPAAWKFAYGEGIKKKGSAAHFDVGQGIHDLMHVYYEVIRQGFEPGSYDLMEFMQPLIQEYLGNLSLDDNSIEVARKITLGFSRFMQVQSPKIDAKIQPVGIEYELLVDTGLVINDRPVYAHGFIDLVYTKPGFAGLHIRDHKTGARPQSHSQAKTECSHQLLFYASWLDYIDCNIGPVEISFIHTEPPKNGNNHFNHYLHVHNKASMAEFRQQTLDAIECMYSDRVPKNRIRTTDCTSCSYWDICRHEVRGQVTNGIRQQYYEQK